jgi:pilus assembly protein CpaE
MPFDAATGQDIAQLVAYVCTDKGADVARSALELSGSDSKSLHGGGLSGAARLCSDTAQAQIILTEIGNISVEMACECVTELSRSGALVVVLGAQTDIGTYRALLKAGAAEYFTFPVSAQDILSVQPKPAETSVVVPLPQPVTKAPSIAILGSNGGVGASMLAQNLAYYSAGTKGQNRRTGLLDADLQFGSLAIDLDRDETVGLFDALRAPDRLDSTYMNATMEHLTDRLSLYSQQIRAGQDVQAYKKGLPWLFPPLREEFEVLITDLPRTVLMQHADLAQHLSVLVLVIPAGFSGVNAASRLIGRIASHEPDVQILPVLSELRHDAGLSKKDIEKTIGLPILATLPRCDVAMTKAQRAGRPLIEMQPRSAYAKVVRAIWDAATAQRKQESRRKPIPLVGRIFK